MSKRFFIIAFTGLLCISCAQQPIERSTRTESTIGTVCTISLYEKDPKPLFDEIFTALDLLEQHVSVTIETSDIAKINAAAGTASSVTDTTVNSAFVQCHDDTFYILQAAIKYAALTDGAFDPSIEPLVKLWGIGTDDAHIPTQTQIDETKTLVDYTKIEINEAEKSVYLPVKGMGLDLGGIAKGYAADLIVQILKQHGSTKAIIDLGGNIYAYGAKSGNAFVDNATTTPWVVGIKNPFDSTGAPILSAQLVNETVVTSGVYERFFIKDGVRYHHLIDKKTGYPAQNGLMSATIITNSSMTADALSTAVFVLGAEKGLALLESLKGVDGVCVNEYKKITATSDIQSKLAVLDSSFNLE